MIFSKQFATMVKAGLPILNVLSMLRDQIEHPTMKEIIEDVRKSLEGGITLSKCFEKYPKIFDNVYINLIKAGEASGKLDGFLMILVESLEKREKVKKKIPIQELENEILKKHKPFLGICVGMQLLANRSYEHGEHLGFGWISGEVVPIVRNKNFMKILNSEITPYKFYINRRNFIKRGTR